MRTMHGKGLETYALTKIGSHTKACETKLLRELNDSLHALSQPMTVLLCTLEYGAGLGLASEMKDAIVVSQEACERLRETILAMQIRVREASEESRTKERVFG